MAGARRRGTPSFTAVLLVAVAAAHLSLGTHARLVAQAIVSDDNECFRVECPLDTHPNPGCEAGGCSREQCCVEGQLQPAANCREFECPPGHRQSDQQSGLRCKGFCTVALCCVPLCRSQQEVCKEHGMLPDSQRADDECPPQQCDPVMACCVHDPCSNAECPAGHDFDAPGCRAHTCTADGCCVPTSCESFPEQRCREYGMMLVAGRKTPCGGPCALPYCCRLTPAPPTDAPPTALPDTATPETPSPPTPAPPTEVPETEAPPTDVPDTAAPPTEAPATDAPDTDAPPTDAPPTSAPPTEVPETPSPPTDVPDTVAPPTEVPPTGVPDTDAPPTPVPETPAPATSMPDTNAPPTDAPPTGAPPTDVPETPSPPSPAPDTQAPPTQSPATDVPDTRVPDTAAPATDVPDTLSPPTEAPSTDTPATDAPDTATPATSAPDTPTPPLPPLAPLPPAAVRHGAPMTSATIRSTGAHLTLQPAGDGLSGGERVSRVSPGLLEVAVLWPGGVAHNGPPGGGLLCGSSPCLTLESRVPPSESKHGVASTASASRLFVKANLTADAVHLSLHDAQFRSFGDKEGQVTLRLSAGFFSARAQAALCANDTDDAAAASSAPPGELRCGCAGCTLSLPLSGEPVALPFTAEQEASKTAATAGTGLALTVSMLTGASGGTVGAALARLSIISRMCPSGGAIELDATLSPTRLRLGSHADTEEVNGALAAAAGAQALLVLVSCAAAAAVARHLSRLRKAKRDFSRRGTTETEAAEGDRPHPTLRTTVLTIPTRWSSGDAVYLAARARFGWILVPSLFLYPAAAMCSAAALLYSPAPYKLLAGADAVVFLLGTAAYAFVVARRTPQHAAFEDGEGGGGVASRVFWGQGGWATRAGHGHAAWMELNHLLFDGYAKRARYFLTFELLFLVVVGAVGGWNPQSQTGCEVKSYAMLGLVGSFFLTLVVLRPYIAPYENVLEIAVSGAETAMLVLILLAEREDSPADSRFAEVAASIAVVVTYVIFAKVAIDVTVFAIDEHGAYAEAQEGVPEEERVSFVRHVLCFGNSMHDGRLHGHSSYIATRRVEEVEVSGDAGSAPSCCEEVAAGGGGGAPSGPLSSRSDGGASVVFFARGSSGDGEALVGEYTSAAGGDESDGDAGDTAALLPPPPPPPPPPAAGRRSAQQHTASFDRLQRPRAGSATAAGASGFPSGGGGGNPLAGSMRRWSFRSTEAASQDAAAAVSPPKRQRASTLTEGTGDGGSGSGSGWPLRDAPSRLRISNGGMRTAAREGVSGSEGGRLSGQDASFRGAF